MHHKVERFIRKLLTVVEISLAVLTLIVLVGNLGIEAYRVIVVPTYFPGSEEFLHDMLGLAVGLEFVRMLVDMTPANILEVLTVAIARQIIISHEDPLGLLVGVVCLAGIFAVRRFLIRHKDMQVELSKAE
ncbi:MAG: hypothetical protein IJB04_01530 [Oscillospiraceae bacterium]|nr:hypothetical protein [Oscillospiraceae bacterium]